MPKYRLVQEKSRTFSVENNKTPGPDGIFVEFIKNLDFSAAMVCLSFLNLFLQNGVPSL
jgi:hypothetical protein